MASGSFQPLIPIFYGKNYDNWSYIVIVILFSSKLLEIVEKGFIKPQDESTLGTHAQRKCLKKIGKRL